MSGNRKRIEELKKRVEELERLHHPHQPYIIPTVVPPIRIYPYIPYQPPYIWWGTATTPNVTITYTSNT